MSYSHNVPERSSSKRAFIDIEADKEERSHLDGKIERGYLDGQIEREVKKIKAAGSFDSNYWTKLGEVSVLKAKRSVLSIRILQDELADGSALNESDELKRLREEEYLHSLEAGIFRKLASRIEVKPGDEEKNRRGYFMQLWTTSTKGLGILGSETGRGKRSRHIQGKFREKLIVACKSKHPDPIIPELWCPVLGHFFPGEETMHAAHIFPWADGQVAMDEFFGREVENVEELNEIQNGLMLSTYAEKRLEDGDIVLVPDVKDAASQEEIDAWSNSEPKEYKIRVINPNAKGMDRAHPGYVNRKETWNNLDGEKVQFSSDHRPRARYLYWQYCKAVLRQSWKEKDIEAKDVLMRERGKKFWGTEGPYIKKRMLLAFVEQLGHDHEALMENAIVESEEDNNPESDPSALLLASAEIRRSHRKYNEDEDEEDEDEESGDDESS